MYRMESPSTSLKKKIKNEFKIIFSPINDQKILQQKTFPSLNISEIFTSLYKDAFPLILQQSRSKFLDKINKEAEEIISQSSFHSLKNKELISDLKEKLIKKYDYDYKFLSLEYKHFLQNKKNYNYFCHFRKHCGKTDNYGYHYCDSNYNKKAKFIEIKKNGIVSYVICEGCKLCYYTDFILMFCSNCNRKYFSNILTEKDDGNILPATWGRYHCNTLINEIMKCIKCKNVLYLNLSTGLLLCLNKVCNFTSKPEDIIWTCNLCGSEFSSYAKVYNPIEFQILKQSIKFALIKHIKAAPKKLPCGCSKDLSKLVFYHKEECRGELLRGTLMDKYIIVCSKCHAINFEDKFTWICPVCEIKFHLHSIIGTKPFVKKKYVINKSFNRSLGINEGKYYLMKNLKNIDNPNEKEDILNKTTNIHPKTGGNPKSSITNSKRIDFKNIISKIDNISPSNQKKNQIYDYNQKIIITDLRENKICDSNSKKKKYRTLLDYYINDAELNL